MTFHYKKLTFHNISVMCLLLTCLQACQMAEPYDMVIINANVYNVETGEFEPSNMAIRDGKIAQISKEHISGSEELDLAGKYVYPGFIDAHAHFVNYASGLWNVNLLGTKSFSEVVQRVTDFIEDNPNLPFISGRGWDQNDWELKEFPTNDTLNLLFPDLPVMLERIDGHASLANQAALDLIGDMPIEVAGGSIIRVNGQPTGLLIDRAAELIPVPKITIEVLKEHLMVAQKNCFAFGITGVVDAGLDKKTILTLDSLQKQGFLKMPIYAMISNQPEEYEWFFKHGSMKSDLMHVNSIKVYGDGALGSRGALLLQPYADDPQNSGLILTSLDDIEELCLKAHKKGFQVNVHAIGDSANRAVVQIFAKVLKPGNDQRWRIEHAQVVNPADSTYWSEYNIIPSVQPTHATSDMYWAEERLGADRVEYAYPFKSLLKWSNRLALGTDFPVEDIDPRKTLYAAVTRQDQNMYPDGGFIPEQRLSREEALLGMTLWAAYAQFEENEKGSIEVGKWADFVISSTNLMTCEPEDILTMPIEQTIVHGETVFKLSE